MNINGINIEAPTLKINNNKGVEQKGTGFANVITDAINDVNKMQVDADKNVEQMLTGKNRNIHETMLSMEKADISLKVMVGVRNKAMEAYNTIMRMQS